MKIFKLLNIKPIQAFFTRRHIQSVKRTTVTIHSLSNANNNRTCERQPLHIPTAETSKCCIMNKYGLLGNGYAIHNCQQVLCQVLEQPAGISELA